MSINIAKKYIDFSNECLIQYMKLIGGSKISKANFKEILATYNGVRYYNYYPIVSHNKNSNLNYYINEKMRELYPEYSSAKVKGLTDLVKFILGLDFIHLDQIEGAVLTAESIRDDKKQEIDFQQELTKLLKENMNRKIKYLNGFKSDTFTLNYLKTNNPKVALVDLSYDIKFPVLYSETAIKKVYNSGIIDEQKLFIEYSLISIKILKEIINNDFVSKYIVDFPYSIFDKKSKKTRLFTLIDNDAIKEKLVIKMNSLEYEKNQDAVIEMLQAGYKLAIELDSNFDFGKNNVKRLEVFEYIIVDKNNADKIDFKDKIIIRK